MGGVRLCHTVCAVYGREGSRDALKSGKRSALSVITEAAGATRTILVASRARHVTSLLLQLRELVT